MKFVKEFVEEVKLSYLESIELFKSIYEIFSKYVKDHIQNGLLIATNKDEMRAYFFGEIVVKRFVIKDSVIWLKDFLISKKALDRAFDVFEQLYITNENYYKTLSKSQDILKGILKNFENVVAIVSFVFIAKSAIDLRKATLSISETKILINLNRVGRIKEDLENLNKEIETIGTEINRATSLTAFENFSQRVNELKSNLERIEESIKKLECRYKGKKAEMKELMKKSTADAFFNGSYSAFMFMKAVLAFPNIIFVLFYFVLSIIGFFISKENIGNREKAKENWDDLIKPIEDCDVLMNDCIKSKQSIDELKNSIYIRSQIEEYRVQNQSVLEQQNEEIQRLRNEITQLKSIKQD